MLFTETITQETFMCSPRLLFPLAAASRPGQMPTDVSFSRAAWRQALLLLHYAASCFIPMPTSMEKFGCEPDGGHSEGGVKFLSSQLPFLSP